MARMEPTAGPWKVSTNGICDHGDRVTRRVFVEVPRPALGNAAADCFLIAAAPAMLEALEAVGNLLIGLAKSELESGRKNAALNVARTENLIWNAVAKARGEEWAR